VRYTRITRYALFLMIAMVLPMFSAGVLPKAHAPTTGTQYFLTPVPVVTQEGYTIVLVLTVIGALPSTTYQFNFQTKDPSGKTWTSSLVTENTTASETSFSKLITYPSPNFIGTNSLCCTYNAQANQIKPLLMTNVASTPFGMIITDRNPAQYQRTETVGIRASGYNASESVGITIRTFTTSTLVFSQTLPATAAGIVSTSWKVPKNATIDNYIVTVTGTTTKKSPPDAQGFSVSAAIMTISTLTSSKTTYQRTETMSFSFQPSYPDGSLANTGIGLLTLAPPTGTNITLTANYDSLSQSFIATYKTFLDNQTGTWTATIAAHAYGDGYGNAGPSTVLTNTPQLIPATLTININATSYVPIGQQVKFNATITYPDGTSLTSGSGIGAYLLYSGSPPVNRTITGFIFDTTIQKWVGSYSPQSSDPGGLYSLVIKASDSPNPPNTGSATKAVTLQDKPPVATFTPSTTSGPTGTPITFDGTGSYDPDGTVVTWSWTFGDTTSGSGSTVAHTYAIAGDYTVTLTVTDNGGYSSSSSSQIAITDRPPAVTSSPSPTTPSPGQTVTLTINASDPDGTITATRVDWGDGTIDNLSAVTTDSHTYALTGSSTSNTFTIAVTVTDNSGKTASTSSQVTVTDQPPAVSFTPSTTTTSTGQTVTVTISASDPDGTITTTSINWGDGKIDTLNYAATSDSHAYNSTGSTASKTYTITVVVTDNRGQTSTANSAVMVQSSGSSSGNVSFPLYYFGILAALIAAILAGGFLAIRRHKVTHAKLKIDLEAVKSEAGRIENQEFFQSVKDQLKRDKDD